MSDFRLFLSTEAYDPISAAIRLRTECAWSHVGFYRLTDSWTFSAMSDGKGVSWRKPFTRARVLVLDAPGIDDGIAWAIKQQGKPYDFLNILGIALGTNWENPNNYMCAKLVFGAMQQTGHPLVNHTFIPIQHMTPRDILLSPFIQEVKL